MHARGRDDLSAGPGPAGNSLHHQAVGVEDGVGRGNRLLSPQRNQIRSARSRTYKHNFAGTSLPFSFHHCPGRPLDQCERKIP